MEKTSIQMSEGTNDVQDMHVHAAYRQLTPYFKRKQRMKDAGKWVLGFATSLFITLFLTREGLTISKPWDTILLATLPLLAIAASYFAFRGDE